MNSCKATVVMVALLSVVGCQSQSSTLSETNTPGLPSRFAEGLTLVAVSEAGDLIDAVSLSTDDTIRAVVFSLPKDHERMRVVAWGDRIHEAIPKGGYAETFGEAQGGLGRVRVHLENGVVTAMDGNGFGAPYEMPSDLVEQVEQHLDAGRGPLESTVIERR